MDSIERHISEIPLLENAKVVRSLGGGPASDSWLLEKDGNEFVVRVDTPLAAALPLDREGELGVLQRVAAAGIGPEVVWADPASGILVTGWIPGKSWSPDDARSESALVALAETLRGLHAVSHEGRAFDPAAAADQYAGRIGSTAARSLAGRADALWAELEEGCAQKLLCHNDLVHGNIIGYGPVYLIDWEYAALGNPLFDLATVVRHHELDDVVAQSFLEHYLGRIDEDSWHQLSVAGILYDIVTALWYKTVSMEPSQGPAWDYELNRALNRIEPGLTI